MENIDITHSYKKQKLNELREDYIFPATKYNNEDFGDQLETLTNQTVDSMGIEKNVHLMIEQMYEEYEKLDKNNQFKQLFDIRAKALCNELGKNQNNNPK